MIIPVRLTYGGITPKTNFKGTEGTDLGGKRVGGKEEKGWTEDEDGGM